MSTDAWIKAATDLAFTRLSDEIFSLATGEDSEDSVFDGASYLLMFAELVTTNVDVGGEYVRLHLRAGVPSNPFQELNLQPPPPAREHLIRLIEQPRKAAEAGVNHFFALAGENDPITTTVYDLLLDDKLQPLRSMQALSESDNRLRIKARTTAFQAAKTEAWTGLAAGVLAAARDGVLSDEERNKLDRFIFELPDILAISLPIIGAPIVHCYFGVSWQAYLAKPPKLIDRLRANFRRLREAVWPFVLARLSASASKYLSMDVPVTTPVKHTALFLREAAGLLLAKSAVIPPSDQKENVAGYSCPADLQRFEDGERLEIELPRGGWTPGKSTATATFQLPKFNVLPDHGEVNRPQSSVDLDGTPVQLAIVRNLIEQLADVIYSLSVTRGLLIDRQAELKRSAETIAEREAAISAALQWVRRMRKEVGPELLKLELKLQFTARTNLRSFLERLPLVMPIEPGSEKLRKMNLESPAIAKIENTMKALVDKWVEKLGVAYSGSGDLAHYLRALDGEPRAVETDALRSAHAQAVVACTRIVYSTTILPDMQAENAVEIVRMLSQTRIMKDGKRFRSILGWALDQKLLSYDGETRVPVNYSPMLTGKAIGNSGELHLDAVTIGPSVPPLAVTLFLAVAASWCTATAHAITLKGSESNGTIHFSVRVHNPTAREWPEYRRNYKSIVEMIEERQSQEANIERFRYCLSLLDDVYQVSRKSPMPPETGDFFEVYLDGRDENRRDSQEEGLDSP